MSNNNKDIEHIIKNLDLPEPSQNLENKIMAITEHEQAPKKASGFSLKGLFSMPAVGLATAACLALVIALNIPSNQVPQQTQQVASYDNIDKAYEYFSPVLDEMFPEEYYSELELENIVDEEDLLDDEIEQFYLEEIGDLNTNTFA